jgi:hypothetical protein
METKTLYGGKGIRESFMAGVHPDISKDLKEAMYQGWLAQNPAFQSHKPTSEEMADYIEDYFNSYQNKEMALIKQMERKHRTLQQSFSKFTLKWIEYMATDEYRVDGRNQASQQVAKRLIVAFQDWLRVNDPNCYDLLPSSWLHMV